MYIIISQYHTTKHHTKNHLRFNIVNLSVFFLIQSPKSPKSPKSRKTIGCCSSYPLVMTNSLLLKMAIEIVSFPIKNGDFPYFFVCLPEGTSHPSVVSRACQAIFSVRSKAELHWDRRPCAVTAWRKGPCLVIDIHHQKGNCGKILMITGVSSWTMATMGNEDCSWVLSGIQVIIYWPISESHG